MKPTELELEEAYLVGKSSDFFLETELLLFQLYEIMGIPFHSYHEEVPKISKDLSFFVGYTGDLSRRKNKYYYFFRTEEDLTKVMIML